jgi:hypothetical protein
MKKQLLMIAGVAALLVLGTGCPVVLVGGAGAGTWAYVKGEIKGTEEASLDKTWTATLAAMKDLEYPVTYKAKDALAAEMKAVNSSGTSIDINLKKLSDSATEIRIRVGIFGDEPLSRTILNKINGQLGIKSP